MEKRKDITILLALKDREIYTQRWLDHSVFPEFTYIIADGSLTDNNEKICSKINLPNVTYERYAPDTTYPIYIRKRLSALNKISTRFVLYADNDDFVLRDGLNKTMDFLSLHPEVSMVQGKVGLILEEKNEQFLKCPDWDHFLENKSPFENFKTCLSQYFSLFYCISETKIQREIFNMFLESGTESPYLVEAFQTYFSIAMSNSRSLPYYYYVRLRNPVQSQNRIFTYKHQYDACLEPSFHNSFFFLAHKLSKHFKEVDEPTLVADLREFQISKIRPKPPRRLREQILERLLAKLSGCLGPLKKSLAPKTIPIAEIPNLYKT